MVFDRISLINIYDALAQVEENERRVNRGSSVANILINKTSKYGTKTLPRFDSISKLKDYIQVNYPYQVWNPDCECVTCNESMHTLLNFTVSDEGEDLIFVNNLRKSLESAKGLKLNATSRTALNNLFNARVELENLLNTYTCFSYVQVQQDYFNPCEYTDFITNAAYHTLIDKYYKLTKRADFPVTRRTPCR